MPAAKGVGKEHLLQSVPDLMEVVNKKIAKGSAEKHDIKYS